MTFETVGVIGLGVVGGAVFDGLKARKDPPTVLGFDIDASRREGTSVPKLVFPLTKKYLCA